MQTEMPGKELKKIVTSQEFRSRLADAARITIRTGYESGFVMYRNMRDQKDYWPPILEGGTDEIDWRLKGDWEVTALRDWPWCEHTYELLQVHFHPTTVDQPLGLSLHDCCAASNPTSRVSRLSCIGATNNDGEGRLLVMQPTMERQPTIEQTEGIAGALHQNYLDAASMPMEHEFAKSLEVPGFVKAEMLRIQVPNQRPLARILNPQILLEYGYRIRADTNEEG